MPWRIPLGLMWAWQASLTSQQWKKFQAAVEQQIAEGRSIAEARTRAAMSMIESDPHTQQAQAILQTMYEQVPERMRGEYGELIDQGVNERQAFLGDYDARMGGVQGILDDYGTQALKDVKGVFGRERGRAIGQLTDQGLTGSGVGASIAHGFATREADALARAREAAALVKSNQAFQIESGRAAYDAAMRGDTQALRERALQSAYGTEIGLGQGLADFQAGRGQQALDTFLGTTGDYMDFITGIQNQPPSSDAVNQFALAFGRGAG